MTDDERGGAPRPRPRRGHRVEVGDVPWRSAADLDGSPAADEAEPVRDSDVAAMEEAAGHEEPPAAGPPPLPEDLATSASPEMVEELASEPPPSAPPALPQDVAPASAPPSSPPPAPSEPPPVPTDHARPASEPPPPPGSDRADAADADPDDLELEEVGPSEQAPALDPAAAQPPPPPIVGGEARSADAGFDPRPTPPPPSLPRRARARTWFDGFFNDDYMRTVPPARVEHVRRDCDFIERSFGLSPGAAILDVGCGLGVHAIELASRGYSVVGFDLSLPMLARAGEEAQERGLHINFLQGDMRDMAFDGRFDAVLCWGTSFGYFDDEANRRVIGRLYSALKPMGLLLLDVVNRDFVLGDQPNLVWFEGDGCVCMEETQFNYITSRLEVKRTVILDDGRQRETHYALRLYSLHELGQLLHLHGFRVAQVSGNLSTPGVFFGADSRRMLILAERRLRGGTGVVPLLPDDPTGAAEPPREADEPAPDEGGG